MVEIRYTEVDEEFLNLAEQVQNKSFPELREMGIKIKYLFDTKARKHGGKIVLGSCAKASDVVRILSQEEVKDPSGYDYVITIDQICWDNVDEVDRIRLLRHELRHCLTNGADTFKILQHDLEDFSIEVQLNVDDPVWAQRAAQLTESIYEQMKDNA